MAVGKGKGKTQSAKIASSAKVQTFSLFISFSIFYEGYLVFP